MHEAIRLLRLYRFALAAAGLALAGTLLSWPLSQHFPFALFLVAVMVTAWRDGLRPGLVTTGCSTISLLLIFLLIPSAWQAALEEHFLIRLSMFALIGVLASYLSMKCRQVIVVHDRFHDTLASLGEALIFTDVRGNITFVNPAAQTLTGWSPAEAEGKPLTQVLALFLESTRQSLGESLMRVLRDNTALSLPDGTLLLPVNKLETAIEGKAIPLHDTEGRVVGMAVALHGAGARRQTELDLRQREQRFRSALGASPAALLLLDPRGQCLFSNRACQALGGFSFDEALGQGWTRCIHLQDRDAFLNDWSQALQGQVGSFHGEFRTNGGAGDSRRLALHAAPVFCDEGQALGYVASLEDVTDRQAAEQSRRASEEKASAAAQRQKQVEEALGRLREELERQLHAAADARRQIDGRVRELEAAKGQAETARDELAHRLGESENARQRAEEALHGSQLEFARLMDEHLAAKKQAEEALQQARDDFARQLAEHAAARREAEADLRRRQEELDPRLEEHAAARCRAEEALRTIHQEKAQEMEKLTADFLNDMAILEEKLAHARLDAETAKQATDSLRQEIAAQQAQLEERQRAHDLTRQQADELARENERLQTLHRSSASPPAVPDEIEANGHAEHDLAVAGVRTSEDSGDWLSFN